MRVPGSSEKQKGPAKMGIPKGTLEEKWANEAEETILF